MDLFGLGGRIFRARLKRGLPCRREEALVSPADEEALAARNRLRRVPGRTPRLGHAPMTLGTRIYGANIGPAAQILNIEADPAAGPAAWAIGLSAGRLRLS